MELAQSVLKEIIEHGAVAHGWLGVGLQVLNDGLRQSFGFKDKGGISIAKVNPEGPAAASGLKPGDIITKINDTAITDVKGIVQMLAQLKPNTHYTIEYFRSGKTGKADVLVTPRPSESKAAPTPTSSPTPVH